RVRPPRRAPCRRGRRAGPPTGPALGLPRRAHRRRPRLRRPRARAAGHVPRVGRPARRCGRRPAAGRPLGRGRRAGRPRRGRGSGRRPRGGRCAVHHRGAPDARGAGRADVRALPLVGEPGPEHHAGLGAGRLLGWRHGGGQGKGRGAMTADAESSARRPILADVARLAGVSIATASKALNGREQVREETRQKVILAAEQLSFRPNVLARQLQQGRSGAVGLVPHDLEGRFSIPILLGAEDEAGTGEVSVLLCDARGDKLRERYHVQALLGRRVDGLIVVGARPDVRSSLGRLPVPVVYAYAPSDDPEDMSEICDNVEAGRLVAEHLLARGRRRIAIVSGDESYGAARERVQGATEALAAAGLEPVGGRAVYGSWDEAWGRTAV